MAKQADDAEGPALALKNFRAEKGDAARRVEQFLKLGRTDQIELMAWAFVTIADRLDALESRVKLIEEPLS